MECSVVQGSRLRHARGRGMVVVTVRLYRVGSGGRFRDWKPPAWTQSRAGRRWDFTPSGRDDVDPDMEIYQHVQAESAARRNLSGVPSDLPAASETLRQFLRDEVTPELRGLGFKGSGGRFSLDRGEFQGYLELQKSVRNDKSFCEFTFLWRASGLDGALSRMQTPPIAGMKRAGLNRRSAATTCWLRGS